MTVSMETVRMAKSRPKKNQSERLCLKNTFPYNTGFFWKHLSGKTGNLASSVNSVVSKPISSSAHYDHISVFLEFRETPESENAIVIARLIH